MSDITPPRAKRTPEVLTRIGRTRTDPYHWMKDKNWQQVMRDPSVLQSDIRAYLEAENAYTKAHLEAPNESLCTELLSEMRGRIKEDDSSVPAIDGPFAYYRRYNKGAEYPIYARRAAQDAFDAHASETILFNGETEAKGKAYFDIGEMAHSPDHKLLAYSIDDQGSEYGTIRIREIQTGRDLGVKIENTTGDVVWASSSDAFYWIFKNENGRPEAVFRRYLATNEDTLIYREDDEGFFLSISESQSGELIFITSNDHTTSEWRWLPAGDLNATPRLIARRAAGHEYDVAHHDGAFYIQTNLDDAVDFKIMRADLDSSDTSTWTEVISHTPGTLLLGLFALKDYLIRLEREMGLPRIVVRSRETKEEYAIQFSEAAYTLELAGGYEYDTAVFRFTYASPTMPDQVYDYNIATHERVLRKTRDIPSGHNPDDYVTDRLMVPADDGEEVPVTLLMRKGTNLNGKAPLLLYGYGSYGITIPASFSSTRLSLVDRGFIYAIAHVRGSTAKGYQWYLDGKLDKKFNTFTDYISVAKYLIDERYTSAGKIVGMGGSAGGLLMGAASNLAPDLFAGIVAAVPFVDVLNTMSDVSLPLTPPEWPEWGNPIENADVYDQILSWSPYDQVADRPYPAMFITGGLSDPRVTYWEPAKWVAKLRHEAPHAGPYYLRINMDAGHGGATGRFEGLKETALEFAFALSVIGN